METKDIYFTLVIIILASLLIITNVEIKEPEPKKERTEKYTSTCENWEVCDYLPSITCTEMYCPETYLCWRETRNCQEEKCNYQENCPEEKCNHQEYYRRWIEPYYKKYRCQMPTDCFDNPDLEGCEKANCNWCCGNMCTLMGCINWTNWNSNNDGNDDIGYEDDVFSCCSNYSNINNNLVVC